MKNSLRTLGAAVALVGVAAASAAAQATSNNSDQISIGVSSAPVSGSLAPGNAGNQVVLDITSASVGAVTRSLIASGGDNALIGNAVNGSGSGLLAAMTSGNLPVIQSQSLVSSLAVLGTNPGASSLDLAIKSFNNLVIVLPRQSVLAPAPIVGSVRHALVTFRTGSK